jgi:hypothetical protein
MGSYWRLLQLLVAIMMVSSCQTKENTLSGNQEYDAVSKMSLRRAYEFERLKDPATGKIPADIRRKELAFAARLPVKDAARGVEWVKRGPFNIGGRTRALALDILDEDIIVAGGVTGGMWKSIDAGSSYVMTTTPSQIHSVSCVVQDSRPGKENIWYHGTGEEFYGVVSGTSFTSLFSGDGIYKSTDGASSWFQLESTSSGTPQSTQDGTYDFVWKIVVDHTNLEQDVVLAAVHNGIIRSEDGGTSWTEVLGFNASPSDFTDILITPSGVFYACLSADGLGRGVFRSEDGINWNSIEFPINGLYRRIVMTFNPQNENELYLITEGPSTQNQINHALFKYTYISGDGSGAGGDWDERSSNIPQFDCVLDLGVDFDFGTFNSQGSYNLAIQHHPTENTVFVGGTNIYRSTNAYFTNNQTSWIGGYKCNPENPRDYSYPNHHSDQHVFLFSPSNPNVMYNGNDGGIYRTDDCLADSVSWVKLNNGYVTSQFYTVAMEQGVATSDQVIGGMQDNGTWGTVSTAFENAWAEAHNDDGAYCAIPEGREFVIVSSQGGRMYKKQLNENGIPEAGRRIDPENGPSALFINPMVMGPVNNDVIYMSGGKTLWRLDSISTIELTGELIQPYANEAWENISESFISFSGGSISAIDIPRIDNSIIYYGSTVGRLWKLEEANAEPVRTEITGSNFPDEAWLSSVAVNDLNPNEVLVCFSNYNVQSIFHSTDGGESWVSVSGNLEENPDGTGAGPAVYSVELHPSDPQVYIVGTSVGVFSTTELNGDNTIWEQEGAETIGNVIVNMVKSRPYDGLIAVATHGNGIYTSSLDPVEAVGTSDLDSPTFAVQVWPNPFVELLNFSFEAETEAECEFRLLDISGKEIIKQMKGRIPAGFHKMSADIPDIPSGNYIFELRIGQSSRRMQLIHLKD